MDKNSSILTGLIDASVFLAIITSLLYLSGSAYANEYLTVWGVESSLISEKPQDLLIYGAQVWLFGGLKLGFYISAILFATFLIKFYIEQTKKKTVEEIKLNLNESTSKSGTSEHISKNNISDIRKIFNYFIYFSISLILISILFRFSKSQGEERALKEYKAFSESKVYYKGILFNRMKTLTINGKESTGFILANSENLVAVFLPRNEKQPEQVIVIPMSTINSIKALKQSLKILET